jgi:hypothetical protein
MLRGHSSRLTALAPALREPLAKVRELLLVWTPRVTDGKRAGRSPFRSAPPNEG